MPLALLDTGTNPNDNTGSNLRAGGSIINAAIEAINDLPQQTAQNANLVLCGPASGAAALATFRALVALDLGSGTGVTTKFLRGDMTWQTVAGGSATWGSITGTLSAQTDLYAAITTNLAATGGTMDGVTIGGVNPAAGTFTNLNVTPGLQVYSPNSGGDYYILSGGTIHIQAPGGIDFENPGALRWTIDNSGNFIGAGGVIHIANTSSLGTVTGGARIGAISGVMSVINDSESVGLPITRTVGKATFNLSSQPNINAGGNLIIPVSVTGALPGDSVSVAFDSQLGGFGGTGGIVVQNITISADQVQVCFANTDLTTQYGVFNNMYVTVSRP